MSARGVIGVEWRDHAAVVGVVIASFMTLEVGEGFWVVDNHGIKVEGFRVGEVGVGDGNRDGRPVRAQPSSKTVRIVPRSKIIISRLCIPFFAFEFVSVARRASVGVGMLAAVGIEVGVVAEGAVVLRHHARGAEEVFGVEFGIAASGKQGNSFSREEDVLVQRRSGSVGFGEDFAARAVPVKLAVGFGDAAAGGVVEIGDASGGFNLGLGVVGIADGAVVLRVA